MGLKASGTIFEFVTKCEWDGMRQTYFFGIKLILVKRLRCVPLSE